jgi:crotonobetainyl-CoA:carnitine CoA-transferase CaiB-like acyl-CoA transferase
MHSGGRADVAPDQIPADESCAGCSEGLLAGIRVVDLTNVLAGPFCCYQLALQGATVIKIEVPGTGDLARQLGAEPSLNKRLMGASFLAQNAGKKSVTLNLKHLEGKSAFRRLLSTVDVLVENFRPGVMDRLDLGYQSLERDYPGLVYCAISGFGQTGPLSDAPAYDQVVQGLSGVMSITGTVDNAPLRVGYPVADTIGGITAAFAIASALLARGRTGRGRFIDVSMLDSMIASLGWPASNYLATGQPPTPMGNENFTAAPSGTFRTATGPLNIAANKQEQFETLVCMIGCDQLASDRRFADREARKRNRAALTAALEQQLITRSAEEWEQKLVAAGVPAGRVLTVPEALAQPQVQSRQLVRSFPADSHFQSGISVLRSGFIPGNASVGPDAPPPALGEHTDQVLGLLGYSDSELTSMRERGVI